MPEALIFTKIKAMLNRKDFEILKFHADRKYALEKRLLERRLDEKYERLHRLGFHTPSGRVTYVGQLQAAKDVELNKELENLKGDIEAEFFGMRGMNGLENTLPPANTPLILTFKGR